MKKPTIVLLHGFPLNPRIWDSVRERLSEAYEVLTPAFPGFGDKPADDASSMAAWADGVADFLDQSQISDQIHLCGLSMGGYVALEFAARHAARLKRLILCDTKTELDSREASSGRLLMAERMRMASKECYPDLLQDLASQMLPKLLAPSTLEHDQATVFFVQSLIVQSEPLAVAAAQQAMAHRRDTATVVQELKCPLLLIAGENDLLTPPSMMEKILLLNPAGRLEVIADSGHLPPIENPAGFVAALKK
jgi:3-oxoadipate enol-lactonase